MSESIPFGQGPDGRILTASEVRRGSAGQCRCAQCEQRLIAIRRPLRRPYFLHEGGKSHCPGARATAVHRAAVQLLGSLDTLHVPVLDWTFHKRFPDGTSFAWRKTLLVAGEYALRLLTTETFNLPGEAGRIIQPNATAVIGGVFCCIAIVVTHRMAEDTASRMQELDWPALEIKVPRAVDINDWGVLRPLVQFAAPRRWLAVAPDERFLADAESEWLAQWSQRKSGRQPAPSTKGD